MSGLGKDGKPLIDIYAPYANDGLANTERLNSMSSDGLGGPLSPNRASIDEMLKTNIYAHIRAVEPDQIEKTLHKLRPHFSKVFFHRLLKANSRFFAVPWLTGGGSQLLVKSVTETGRCPDRPHSIVGHTNQVTALDLSVLDECALVTACDKEIKVWTLPEGGLTEDMSTPIHSFDIPGKATLCSWSPRVSGLFAVAESSVDDGHNIRFYITGEDAREVFSLYQMHEDKIMDMKFCPVSARLATISKDGKFRVFNIKEKKMLMEMEIPESARDTNVMWVSDGHVVLVGAQKGSNRSLVLIDVVTGELVGRQSLPHSPDTILAHYDPSSKIVMVANSGGRTVNMFAVNTLSAPFFTALDSFQSAHVIRGHVVLPKSTIDIKKVEIFKSLLLNEDSIIPLSWNVLRKRAEFFQDDLFPDVWDGKPVCTSVEWLSSEANKEYPETTMSVRPEGMTNLSEAPEEEMTDRQRRYLEHKDSMSKPIEKNALGHESSEQVKEHFMSIASNHTGGNRWDSAPVESHDVDDDEWSD